MAFAVKQFVQPASGREVVELLAKHGDKALLLGGGTLIHGLAARGVLRHTEVLIDLQKAGLQYVREEAASAASAGGSGQPGKQAPGWALAVGAATTMTDLAASAAVQAPAFAAIADALRYPPAQIRNVATVGGCVASANPLFDLPIALLALDGTVQTLGPGGARDISLHKFFLDYFEHALEAGEFVTEVRVPRLPERTASAFLKLETNANDLAIINAAARVTMDANGGCAEVRVVVGGGVGKVPVRSVSCEDVLKGQKPTVALVREAADVIALDVHAISDHRASAAYRTHMAQVFVGRALLRAFERLGVAVTAGGKR